MRYVDIGSLCLPSGWRERARAAAARVQKGADPNDHEHLWRELKDCLAELLPHKKCWYCESPVDRADNAVDHFRPKNRVADAARPHDGYRWLAFDDRNYRYACTYCNSRRKGVDDGGGGKADRFPLIDEDQRLYEPGALEREQPTLLDPCEISDWQLLGCRQENGEDCPAGVEPTDKTRGTVSIEVYHLNYDPTCKLRHRTALQLIADIEQAKRLFQEATFGRRGHDEFKESAKKVRRAIDRKAPYSGEMIFVLRANRHADHPWIQQILDS